MKEWVQLRDVIVQVILLITNISLQVLQNNYRFNGVGELDKGSKTNLAQKLSLTKLT